MSREHHHEYSHEHHHGHEHRHEHGHTHEHSHGHVPGEEAGERRERLELYLGAGLLAAAVLLKSVLKLESFTLPLILLLVFAYLLLGWRVLRAAFENIREREFLDENFLMAVATLGAFAIEKYTEAVGVMLFFRIGEAFEELAQEKSRRKIRESLDLRPEILCRLKENGEEKFIPAQEARAGDILLLKVGERAALDSLVLEGESFLDTSAITGEPKPLRAVPGDRVLAGFLNSSALLKLQAEKPLQESMVSRILSSVEEAEEQKPHIDRFITRFARVYTPAVVGLALLAGFGIPLLTGQALKPWLYTAISFLVMSCPCALVISIPLAYFCGIGRASSGGVLFKGGAAMEALAGVKALAMDKTGTLTRGEFALQRILPAEGISETELLLLAGAAESASAHPIAKSITEAALARGLELFLPESLKEIPGKGILASVRGKTVLCGSARLLSEEGVEFRAPQPEIPGASLVLLAGDGEYLGALEIADSLKPEAAKAIGTMKKLGLDTALFTGDRQETGEAFGKMLGIGSVCGDLLPEEKLGRLQELRERSGSVLYLGDGINDAPVLAGADVGAAMGNGADAAVEAADMLFLNGQLTGVPEAFLLARKTKKIARSNVILALSIKAAVLLLGITGIYSSMWLAVFADTGVAFLCILNSLRLLAEKNPAETDG